VSASLKTAGGERPSSPPFLGGSAEETEVTAPERSWQASLYQRYDYDC
jgi:hypothetical protein